MQASLFAVVSILVILLSTVSFVLSTIPRWSGSKEQAIFNGIEVVSIAFFTAEYGGRLLTSSKPAAFVCAPSNLLDLVAFVPYFVERGLLKSGDVLESHNLGATRLVRIIRLARIFRLIPASAAADNLSIVFAALRESADMLGVLVFLLSIATVIFSTCMYFSEKRVANGSLYSKGFGPPHGSPFASIPASFWWCIVTLMTVGYGDVVPVTDAGKVVAGLTMVASFIILALPSRWWAPTSRSSGLCSRRRRCRRAAPPTARRTSGC